MSVEYWVIDIRKDIPVVLGVYEDSQEAYDEKDMQEMSALGIGQVDVVKVETLT
jgi:hypothetical protein